MKVLRILLLSCILLVLIVGTAFAVRIVHFKDEKRRLEIPSTASERQRDAGFLSRLSLLPTGTRKRPLLAVMIENHEDARPHQKGLDRALLILEFPVEGFISRFGVLFDRRDLPDLIGPVRSLRPYFIDALMPWKPPILHAGGSPEAYARLEELSDQPAVNGLKFPKEFVRDVTIPAPHNLFIDAEDAKAITENFIEKIVRWPPYETGAMQSRSGALMVFLNFFSTTHNVRYTYDLFSQSYVRDNGGFMSPARPNNVLVLEIPVTGISEFGRLTIPTEGTGDMLLFRNGTVLRGQWHKRPDEWFTFENDTGEPLVFARGQTWLTALPSLDRVQWNENIGNK